MTRRMTQLGLSLAALSTLLMLAPDASARRSDRGDGPPKERLHERMVELRGRLLERRVGLSPDKIARVEATLAAGDAERKALHKAMRDSHRTLRGLIQSDSNDDAAYEAAVTGLLKTRNRLHALRQQELQQLNQLLSPKEMGKLVLALGKLRKRMERMHEKRRGEMRGGPRGDGGERRGRRHGGPHRGDW